MAIDGHQIVHVSVHRRAPKGGRRMPIDGPSFGTMLAGGRRAIQRLALSPVEAGEMVGAPPVRPDDALAIDVDASLNLDAGWRDIQFSLARFRRIGSALQSADLMLD